LALSLGLLGAGAPGPLVLARDSSFYVGGHYAKSADGMVMDGAMYVHALIPARVTHPYPIVMIHGINLTGTTFEGTPDGREGWAQFFVRAGYAVYVVDQPARGRSPYFPDLDGPQPSSSAFGAQALAEQYTAPEVYKQYPQAHLHTQWPSGDAHKGQPGDPVFDQQMSGSVKSIPTSTGTSERLIKAAGAALLDKIGPAILLTHSQGGLAQAGVPNDLIRLGDVGIHGNSHIMMAEKNSDDIARFLAGWLARHGL
jgi:pimeloyl-ACP methyl ester carboxylesterase